MFQNLKLKWIKLVNELLCVFEWTKMFSTTSTIPPWCFIFFSQMRKMGFRLAHPAHRPVRTLIAPRAEVIAVSGQNAAIEEKGAVLAVVRVFYKGRGLARIKLASFPQMGPSLSPKWTNQTYYWVGGDKPLLWFPPDTTPSKSICTVHNNRYTQPWFSHHLQKPWDPTATEQSGVYPHGSVLKCKYSSEEQKNYKDLKSENEMYRWI